MGVYRWGDETVRWGAIKKKRKRKERPKKKADSSDSRRHVLPAFVPVPVPVHPASETCVG